MDEKQINIIFYRMIKNNEDKLSVARGWIVEKEMSEVSYLCRMPGESIFVKVAFEQMPEGSETVSHTGL